MKVVINACHGGFGLSPKALKRYAELKGKPCYFFVRTEPIDGHFKQVTEEEAKDAFLFYAFTVENPEEVAGSQNDWHEMTMEERRASSKRWDKIRLSYLGIPRNDPHLVQVVEELGREANNQFAKLKVVEIPDDVDFQIEDYDGSEHIAEVHRTWR